MSEPDWNELREIAKSLTKSSYAPYSNFRVGAAAITSTGATVTGCNVENASYGLTLCAECGLVSDLHAKGAGKLAAIVVVSGSGEHCPPCGRCRQLLLENSVPDALIDTADGPIEVKSLLPYGFNADRMTGG